MTRGLVVGYSTNNDSKKFALILIFVRLTYLDYGFIYSNLQSYSIWTSHLISVKIKGSYALNLSAVLLQYLNILTLFRLGGGSK